MLVLGIETSCDETGVALYDAQAAEIIAEDLFSQVDVHRIYGGVVPELASRDHLQRISPLVNNVCEQAGVSLQAISGIAYTAGPGLVGALFVGASFARGLAYALGIPAVGVHHMEGHLLAPFLAPPHLRQGLDYPFAALLVSGGHTQLIAVRAPGCYQLLGDTLDDAVGEAFDKVATMLDLPYPGGPALERLAAEYKGEDFNFPRPMYHKPNLDFSFSGLKTHINQFIQQRRRMGQWGEVDRSGVAASFQAAAVDCLWQKCARALGETGFKRLVVAGGVSANQRLRHIFQESAQQLGAGVFFPPQAYCTDNGAMIAYAGCLRLSAGHCDAGLKVDVQARWPLESLCAI